MIGSAVIIRRIVPAAGSSYCFIFIYLILFYQIKGFDFDGVFFDIKETVIARPPALAVMSGIAGETSPDDRRVTRLTCPRSKRLCFCNTATLVIKPSCMDIKCFVQSFRADNKIHASADQVHIKIILSRCIEIGIIQLQYLFAGEGDISLIFGVIPAHFKNTFVRSFSIGTAA